MKKCQRYVVVTILATLGAVCHANAADTMTNLPDTSPESSLYRAQELTIDLFGSGSINQQTINHLSGDKVTHNGRLGAGAGLNYFFCRYIGIGADAYSENTGHSFVDSTSGNLIGRLPIGDTGIAPYIFAGGGYQFDQVEQGFGQGGGGLEFRFTEKWGLFVDARYVIADKTENYGLGRVGLRLSF